jgi:tRNA(Ile)-lysidine synthase
VRAASAAPLADEELDALFAPLAEAPLIGLAVSGGADSLALLDGVARWRARHGGRPHAIVLTVDHGLRRGSAREAAQVAKIARARGLKACVLTWEGPKPQSDIEGRARAARYRLLLEACREARATHLVVAHHQDDLAETFLLRLRRGAGVFGLAAMRPSLAVGDVTIVRPFLGVPRARLAATTVAAELTPVDDAMNSDPRFERTKVRRLLPTLAGEGLDPAMLAATALRLADAADAIDAAATLLLREAVAVDDLAVASLDLVPFARAPQEVRLRGLVRLLLAVGGDDYPPRYERLAALLDAIVAHDGARRFKRTLGGTVIEVRSGRFLFYREIGRARLPGVTVKPGFSGVFDRRFTVSVEEGGPAGLKLGLLGEEGRRSVGATAGAHPAGALAALPAFRRNGRIIAVPALGYGAGTPPATARQIVADRLARPPLFPDLAGGL